MYLKILLISIATIFAAISTNGQSNFGQRPKIDINTLNEKVYEKGIIYVKFSDEVAKIASRKCNEKSATDILSFNIPLIDNQFKNYRITGISKLFNLDKVTKDQNELHRSWGLQKWFALKMPENTNIKDVVLELSKISFIEVAEPVYKIVRYTGDGKREPVSGSARNPFTSKVNNIAPASSSPSENGSKWIPNDPNYSQQQWHYGKIEMPEAWEIHNSGDNVIVSIHDGGVLFSHPDLSANMWWAIGPDGGYTIGDSHGTHVAGTVAAVSNNSLGVAGIAGGSGDGNGARIMSVDIFAGGLSTYEGYVYAADNGSSISQNSWGYESPNVYNTPDLEGIDYFCENGGGDVLTGGVVIFAAGNDSSNDYWYPGCYEKVIAVAATTQTDAKASFSNYGTWVDISAPGVQIYSTDLSSNYSIKQGTSMACPHVSGVAALVVSIAPRALNSEMVKSILLENSDDHYTANQVYVGELGSGRLNAYRAVQAASAYSVNNPSSLSTEVLSKSSISIEWELNSSNDSVLLAYNTINQFGIPQEMYSPQDEIEGGGKVLYFGKEEFSYLHTELDAGTTYYYRLWAYNGKHYSPGLASISTTDCNIYSAPFEYSPTQLQFPNCWSTVSHTEPELTWTVGNAFGGMYEYGDNIYFLFDSYAYGDSSDLNGDLISPVFDFSEENEIYLSFNHFYLHRPGHKISLQYTTDLGENWTEIQSWEADLQNPEKFNQRISAVENHNNVQFKWNYTGSWGYFWCVDSVKISNGPTSSVFYENNLNLRVYPSPFTSKITVEHPINNETNSIYIYDSLGRIIKVEKTIPNASATLLNLSNLSKGLYFIELRTRNSISKAKIIKQ